MGLLVGLGISFLGNWGLGGELEKEEEGRELGSSRGEERKRRREEGSIEGVIFEVLARQDV